MDSSLYLKYLKIIQAKEQEHIRFYYTSTVKVVF